MIYLVTLNNKLFDSEVYKIIGVEESLRLLSPLTIVGLDSETTGINCHKDTLLSVQLGCFEFQIVIDCLTVDITEYKEYLESDRLFILWNAKFDLKWLFKYGIVPKRVYDGFIAEKLMWLGYPIVLSPEVWQKIQEPRYDFVPPEIKDGKVRKKGYYIIYMNLKKAGEMYLGIELDKTVRGKIIYIGLTTETIIYSANDVKYLEKIKEAQEVKLKEKGLLKAVNYENRFVLPLAYMEYCGVKVDINKWKEKIDRDNAELKRIQEELNSWLLENEPNSKYISRNTSPSLFEEFNDDITINWNSGKQVIPIFKKYGVKVETEEGGESIEAKSLKPQASKCSLIPIYLKYKEAIKSTSTYGQNFLNQIDSTTGRLYTNFNSIGTDTARISSGGKDKANNKQYINFLNIPADAFTRSCFIAEKGNRWISIDYSGQESFIMADQANDEAMINELMYGEKDLHTLTAKLVFPEIPKDMPAKEVKKKFHDQRQLAKGYEFAFNYAGNDFTIKRNFGLSDRRALEIYNSYMNGFNGLKSYQERKKKEWWEKGYIDLNPIVGYKAYIYDYKYLKALYEEQKEPGFWDKYREEKDSNPDSLIVLKVKEYFTRRADSDRQAVNYPIQHTGALCSKVAIINFFEWLRNNNLLFKVLITVAPYDEWNCEAPEEIAEDVAKKLYEFMVKSGAYFVKRCKLDAEISRNEDGTLPTFWIH